jgi:uncharacterized repeat protein (TIGR04138 family)
MPEQQEKICETCGQRPARVFLTVCTGVGILRKASLCEACAAEDPTLGASIHATESGCVYCGAPAVGAGAGADGSFKAKCKSCSAAEYEFLLKSFGTTSSEDLLSVLKEMSPEAKAEGLRNAATVEEYMRTRRVRYEKEAYSFVQDSVSQAFSGSDESRSPQLNRLLAQLLNPPGHVTAADLLEIMRILAIERYGSNARAQLGAWGVTRSEDFGEIVFRLAEEGILGLSPEDKKEDFSNGYNFESAFPIT